MNILKNKKVIISSVALVILLITITLVGLNRQPVEVLTNALSNDTISGSTGSTSTVMSSGSYMYYDNYDELDSKADLVFIGEVVKINEPKELIIGEVTNTITGEIESVSDIYTVSDFRVDKVIKGNIKLGDIVKVKQIGGSYKDVERVADGVEYFKLGESHILFLQSYENSKFNTPCSTLNPHQGNMKIINGKTKKTNHYQFINDDVSEDDLVKELKEKVEKNKNKAKDK